MLENKVFYSHAHTNSCSAPTSGAKESPEEITPLTMISGIFRTYLNDLKLIIFMRMVICVLNNKTGLTVNLMSDKKSYIRFIIIMFRIILRLVHFA